MDRPVSKVPSQVPFQTEVIPPVPLEVPLAEAPEPVIRQQETIELWVPKPDLCHEGIPERVEYERLSKLKKLVSKHALKEGPDVAKGSATALFQSATGKYAAAISEVTGLDASIIQQVNMTDDPVNEAQLVKELKDEAEQRRGFEIATQGKVMPSGPAEKVEEAAKNLERALSLDGNIDNSETTLTAEQSNETLGLSDVPPDEGISESVECERLSELKKVVSDHVSKEAETNRTGVSKGNTTALSQSAMDKYVMAISKETGIAPSAIKDVDMAVKPVDETRLAKELKNEAEQRKLFEIATRGKVIPRGPARKVEEASERLERVTHLD